MVISDKTRLKRKVEQIGFQLALKKLARVSADPDRLMQTVPYCRTGNREGTVSKHNNNNNNNNNNQICKAPECQKTSVLVRGTMKSRLLAEEDVDVLGC